MQKCKVSLSVLSRSSYVQHETKDLVKSGSPSDLYLGGDRFKLVSQHRLSWQVFRGFSQIIEENSVMLPQINPPSLLPSSSSLDIR